MAVNAIPGFKNRHLAIFRVRPRVRRAIADSNAWSCAGRRVWPRAACAWSAVCDYRDRSAPAVPSATWTFTPSWRIDPRTRGPRYHKGENHHAIEAHRASR